MSYIHKYEIIEILNNLRINNILIGEKYRADAYKTAMDKILNNEPITFKSPSKILDKIDEIEKTGTLKDYKRNFDLKFDLYEEFKKVFGIGEKKAIELAMTCNSFEDIYNAPLTRAQALGLKYLKEIQTKITKDVLLKHFRKIKKLFKGQIKVQIVGSYRRSKDRLYSDLDILVVSNVTSLKNIFEPYVFLDYFSFGDKKFSGLSKINDSIIRVDILLTTPESYPFALLYFTGPKNFNILMRSEAKSQGLVLNEYGLSDIICKTEKDIFKELNLKYMNLKERELV